VGSIVAVSNNSGAVANKNKFSPFGEITTLGGTTVGFSGQRYDSELGLYYFKHRYYSPKLGRFLQPDPIGYTGRDFNLYTYVGNSPQKYTDPMGLQMCWIPGKGDPVDSYIPWYDNPNGLSGAEWFGEFLIETIKDMTIGDAQKFLEYLSKPHTHAENFQKAMEIVADRYGGKVFGKLGDVANHIRTTSLPSGMQALLKSLKNVVGAYQLPDNILKGKTYNGRSDHDIAARLKDHINKGRLDPNDYGKVVVHSDPDLENTLINSLGGPLSANPNSNASNAIWGPGATKP
jgi:RHS repeat-associated protein